MDWNQLYSVNGTSAGADSLQNYYNNYASAMGGSALPIDQWFAQYGSRFAPVNAQQAVALGAAPQQVLDSGYQIPSVTDWSNLKTYDGQQMPAALGQDILGAIQKNGAYGYTGGTYDPSIAPGTFTLGSLDGQGVISYHPAGQGNGEPYGIYDPTTGQLIQDVKTQKDMPLAAQVAIVLGSALGMGALGAAAGAGGAAGAGAAEGAGAAGLAGDATAAGYGGLSAADAASLGGGASLAGGAAGAGAAGAGAGLAGDATAAGYGGLSAGDAASLGGGASVNGGAALGGTTALGAGGGGASTATGAGVTPPNPFYGSGSTGSSFGSLLDASGNFDWTKLIGPGLNLAGSLYASNAAKSAANTQAQAAQDAANMFAPWVANGGWAVNRMADLLGKNGQAAANAAFTTDPGYQFTLSEGEKALQRAASAQGGIGSGKYLKDAMSYDQGLASQQYSNVYNRLASLAGMGQTATGSTADYTTQGANATAAGTVGSANAIGNGITQGLSLYNSNELLNRLLQPRSGYQYA